MKNIFLTMIALATIAGAAFAAPDHDKDHKHAKSDTKTSKAALICPVTGDKIASVKAAVGHSVYKGKTYYFCCAGCKPRFDKEPAKIVKNAAAHKYEKM